MSFVKSIPSKYLIDTIPANLALQYLDKFVKQVDTYATKMRNGEYQFNTYYIRKSPKKRRKIVAPCKEFIKENRKVLDFLTKLPVIKEHLKNYNAGIHSIYENLNLNATKIDTYQGIIKVDIKKAFDSTSITILNKFFNKLFYDMIHPSNKEKKEYVDFIPNLLTITTLNGYTPQGFPTSKLIFDMIFNIIDNDFDLFLNKGIIYYRYVDDILILVENINKIDSQTFKQELKLTLKFLNHKIESIGYSINKDKIKIVDRKIDKVYVMFLGSCIHHPNDATEQNILNDNIVRKIKCKNSTRNRYRQYKYLAERYNVIKSISVSKNLQKICE